MRVIEIFMVVGGCTNSPVLVITDIAIHPNLGESSDMRLHTYILKDSNRDEGIVFGKG